MFLGNPRFVTVIVGAVLGLGCAPEFNPTAPKESSRSFGEKFFTVACQRVAYTSSLRARELNPSLPVDVSGSRYRQACRYGPEYLPADTAARDPKVATLGAYHNPMVQAVDLIFPGSELSDLQDYMISILPLTDNDSFPAVVRKGAEIIGMMEQDGDLHWSLARLDGRVGYRPREVCLGLVRELLSYDKLHPMLTTLLNLVGEGGKGHQALLDLVEALSLELRTVKKIHDPSQAHPEHPGTADRTLKLAIDLLLTQDPAFGSGGAPMLMVRRDWRGLAAVRPNPQTAALPAPFVDQDKDGLADIDNLLGEFVTSPQGAAVPPPFLWDKSAQDPAASRDADGRALDATGQSIYRYVNLDSTLLAALSRDAEKIMDPVKRTGTRLLLGATALLGGRVKKQKQGAPGEVIEYNGFDTAKSSLLDFLYGVMQMGRDPNIDDTLDAAVLLLKQHENEMARVLGALLDVKDLSKDAKYNSAVADPQSNYYDDVIAVIQNIVNKDGGKLMEDLLVAIGDPRVKNLSGMIADYMRYKDVHLLNQTTLKVNSPFFKTPVDRSLPDTGNNRSIQQRLNHILANTNGMKWCNKEGACIGLSLMGTDLCVAKFKACELFEVENGALFYTQSIARLRDSNGNLTTTPKGYLRLKTENMPGWLAAIVKATGPDTVLKLMAGIDGMSSHPTTEAVNRLMFMDPLPTMLALVQDPAIDVDGHQVNKYHLGTLLSWEVPHPQYSCSHNDPCNFYEAIRPVVQAFADHNAEQLFLDLLTVTHRHYSSKNSKTYQFADPNKPDYSAGSNLVSYEPLIADVLEKTDLLAALNALGPVLDQLKTSGGRPAKQALVQTVAYLVDPTRSPGLTYRDGRTESKTTDGTKTVPGGVSPFYIMADAWAAKRDALKSMEASDKLIADAWNSSTSDLVDIFLTVEGTGLKARFENRRLVPAGEALVKFIRGRIAAHKNKDLASWLQQELPDALEQKLASPVVSRAADFLRIAEDDPPSVQAIYDLIDYLIDELNHNPSFRASVTGIADIAQMLLDDNDIVPVVNVLGKVIEPKRALVKTALHFLKPAVAKDQKQVLSKVLRNAYKEQSPGKSPVQTLLDLATELHRLKPGAGTHYTGPDFQEAFRQAREFLADQETGLEKFFEIVKNRCGGPCSN